MLNSRSRGFTLPEVLITISLLGVVAGALTGIVIRQQRFYASAVLIMDTRTHLRQAVDVISLDLRGLAPGQGDIYAMGPTFIEFRGNNGTGVACAIHDGGGAARTAITIPPRQGQAAQRGLTTWFTAPVEGDSIFIFDPRVEGDVADDIWRVRAISAGPSLDPVRCAVGSAFIASLAEQSNAVQLRLSSALEGSVPVGAEVRFFRRARYQLYQGGDGEWYLGYFDCLSTRVTHCSTIQPVSGPYVPGNVAAPGIQFTYRDSTGAVTAVPDLVRRIDIVARAESMSAVRAEGFRQGVFRDSLAATIRVRN